ncbi:MAG: PAS domain S-box protein [bacterium]|nr:PAS domain S-box protein [bacterium]
MTRPSEDEIQRLRASEEKYRLMVQRANDAIFAIDPESAAILEVNPKAEEMTGFSAAELAKMKVWDLHPEDERELAAELFELVSTAGSGTRTLHFLTKKGATLAVDVSSSFIKSGTRTFIQRNCHDVTDRTRLEVEHMAQRDYYEFIFNMMPVGVGVRKNINNKPFIEFENRRLKEMFHGEDGEHHDESHAEWHRGGEAPPLPTKAILSEDGVYSEERTYPDGRVFQYTLNYYRNTDDSWSELQVVRDITHRKELENQLREAMEGLERKVEERTLELRRKQTQLVQSEKMAALGHLVAGVAHEINTPLGALKSNNDLLVRSMARLRSVIEESELSEVVKQDTRLTKVLDGIDSSTGVNQTAMERIVKLVRSLKKFARLDEAEQDEVDIREGLESTLLLVHHELKDRIEVHREYGDIPRIYCYPNQINQIFMNVIVNASQAIQGKGDIFIKTSTRDDNVVVEFRDTGKGISPENLERVFDPGFTTKGVGIGTGLGLSIVYQIIQDHHGDIELESSVGKGTTVRIILPISQGGKDARDRG